MCRFLLGSPVPRFHIRFHQVSEFPRWAARVRGCGKVQDLEGALQVVEEAMPGTAAKRRRRGEGNQSVGFHGIGVLLGEIDGPGG